MVGVLSSLSVCCDVFDVVFVGCCRCGYCFVGEVVATFFVLPSSLLSSWRAFVVVCCLRCALSSVLLFLCDVDVLVCVGRCGVVVFLVVSMLCFTFSVLCALCVVGRVACFFGGWCLSLFVCCCFLMCIVV